MTCKTRVFNILKWLGLMIDTFVNSVFFFIPVLPLSTRLLLDFRDIDPDTLSINEIMTIRQYVIVSGWVTIGAFFGFFFGCLGSFTPKDVFNQNLDNPVSVIIEQRKNNKCCICLSNFHSDDSVYVSRCAHVFHSGCIISWQRYSSKCPLCKNLLGDRLTF
jgi:hypothetical protein